MSERRGSDSEDTALDLFGLTIHVSNPSLAEEALRMDGGAVLVSDMRESADPGESRRRRETLAQGVPDTVLRSVTPKDAHEVSVRSALRQRCDSLGHAMGFSTENDGSWCLAHGPRILTRVIEGSLSPAAAADMVSKLESLFDERPADRSLLFVVDEEVAVVSLLVAIRQRRAHHWARVARIGDLETLGDAYRSGVLDESGILARLTVIGGVDVGVTLPATRSAK